MPTTTTADSSAGLTSKRGEQLLDELEAIILAEGFSQLNVSDIAARLACSKRTLYELAASRNDLVKRVVARFFERIRRDAAQACSGSENARQRVYDFLQVGVRAAARLGPVAVNDIQSWAPTHAIWQAHVSMRVNGLRKIIEAGIAAGEFHHIHAAFVAEIVFASINRLREPDFCEATALTISEAFDELYRMLLLTLEAPA